MRSRDFVYWLQGYLELAPPGPMSVEQVHTVKRHLELVFIHEIDPSAGPPEHQEKLNEAHKVPTQDEPAWKRPPGPSGETYRC